ncbi:MAG: DUF3078 domain-containing protein [Bacteroidales bacterium]|jgi:hypothetical protein
MKRIGIFIFISYVLLSVCGLAYAQEIILEPVPQDYPVIDTLGSEVEIPVTNIMIEAAPVHSTVKFFTRESIDSLQKEGAIFYTPQEKPSIFLSAEQALEYLRNIISPVYWREENDPLRENIGRLVYHITQPHIDTTINYLTTYQYDSLDIPWEKYYRWDTLTFVVPDVLTTDSTDILMPVSSIKDTTILVVTDTLNSITPADEHPLRLSTAPYQIDSLYTAINALLKEAIDRDSTNINITGFGTGDIAVWLNSKSGMATRYWLKSDAGDSVTIWISSPERNTINLILEHGVNIIRPILRSGYSEASIEREKIDNTALLEINNIEYKNRYWKTHADASFALNQTGMSNWVKGGENTIAVTTELVGYADYDNKNKKITSNNFARIKYGLVTSQEYGVRKNIDLLETSSKVNTKAFGKFDFSGYMLIKTTIAKGYKYPNDSVAVSKFMNPGTITVGVGLDYKPNKKLSVNFSPFSYKGTFVTDTVNIDQTLYGLDKSKKSKHEPGMGLLVNHTWDMTKKIKIINKLQLFTNYIDKPQNVDVDWEMTFTAKLNWFTDFKLNTHLIFDDNTKTLEYDKKDNPVLWPDGTQKRNARIQFKEIIGFSFIFTF